MQKNKEVNKKNCNYTFWTLEALSCPPKSGTGVSLMTGEINPFGAKQFTTSSTREAPSLLGVAEASLKL